MELLVADAVRDSANYRFFHSAARFVLGAGSFVLCSGSGDDRRHYYKTLAFGDPTAGWPSLVCIILLLSGIQMLGIGILGQYLAKTYLETKRRPIYLVAQTNIETRK